MSLASSDVPEIQRWLLEAVHVDDGGASFVKGLAERLRDLGLPLWRASFSLLTKHPEVLWRTVHWREDGGVKVIERQHATSHDPYFTQSPVAKLVQGSPPIRVRLAVEEDLVFPICRDLKAEGATDYYAQGLKFSNGEISYASW